MRFFNIFYVYFRILSLDVAVGAGLMAYLFAYALGVPVDWMSYFSLAIAVWLIYTLDHLWDAYKIPHEANTLRHRFHQKYFTLLGIIWGTVGIGGALLIIFYLPVKVIVYGLGLSVFVLGHFSLTFIDQLKNTLLIQKETRTALIYSLGVGLAPISIGAQSPYLIEVLMTTQVFLIAWINLLIISYYEYNSDQKDAHISTAIKLGKERTLYLINVLIISQLLLNVSVLFFIQTPLVLPLILLFFMNLTLGLIIYRRKFFKKNERYRALSDAIFYMPVILIFWEYGTRF